MNRRIPENWRIRAYNFAQKKRYPEELLEDIVQEAYRIMEDEKARPLLKRLIPRAYKNISESLIKPNTILMSKDEMDDMSLPDIY